MSLPLSECIEQPRHMLRHSVQSGRNMEKALNACVTRHRVPAPGLLGTNYAPFSSFSTGETELPTFLTAAFN